MNIDPSHNLIENESEHIFLSFCTFVMNLKGKKLSVQNVFVQTLQDEKLKNVMKTMLSLDNDYELVKVFLAYDQNLCRSKFITKWINNHNRK